MARIEVDISSLAHAAEADGRLPPFIVSKLSELRSAMSTLVIAISAGEVGAESLDLTPGDVVVLRALGENPTQENMAAFMQSILPVIEMARASALFLGPEYTIERYQDEQIEWLADNQLMLLCNVEAGERMYAVVDRERGQLTQWGTFVRAIAEAREKLDEAQCPAEDTGAKPERF